MTIDTKILDIIGNPNYTSVVWNSIIDDWKSGSMGLLDDTWTSAGGTLDIPAEEELLELFDMIQTSKGLRKNITDGYLKKFRDNFSSDQDEKVDIDIVYSGFVNIRAVDVLFSDVHSFVTMENAGVSNNVITIQSLTLFQKSLKQPYVLSKEYLSKCRIIKRRTSMTREIIPPSATLHGILYEADYRRFVTRWNVGFDYN